MHVDHQIVFRASDLFEQIEKAQRGAPFLTGLREIASREENHIRERGMMTDDLRVLGCDQPVNARMRITRTQFYQHWDRVHNVAERRRLDQQNARELGGLQWRSVLPFSF
jgi:hypothetical protein